MKCPNCNKKAISKILKYRKLTYCETCDYFTIDPIECCTKPDYVYKKHKNMDGNFTLRKQCKNCGFKDPKIYSKKEVDNFNQLKPFDINLEKRRNIEIQEEYKYTQEVRSKNFFKGHHKYLNSNEWKIKRNLVLKRDAFLCQSCLTHKATHVHHMTYLFWRNEPLFTLTSLCNRCHDIVTEIERLERQNKSIDKVKTILH